MTSFFDAVDGQRCAYRKNGVRCTKDLDHAGDHYEPKIGRWTDEESDSQ